MRKLLLSLTVCLLILSSQSLANPTQLDQSYPQVTVETNHLYSPSGTLILQFRLVWPDKSWRLNNWALTLLKVKGVKLEPIEWKPGFPGFVTESIGPVPDNAKLDVEFRVEGSLCKGATCKHQKIIGQLIR